MDSEGGAIAFVDVETTMPQPPGQERILLEFGAILVCPRRLVEVDSFSTLIRPHDPSRVSPASLECKGITREEFFDAPTFRDVADVVHNILHGRVWAGHNIDRFDCHRIREAFEEIDRPAPKPKRTIDSLTLLTDRFGTRAGNMKLASLADYFGLSQQEHRSLADVRTNLQVLRHCAAVLFLESSCPDIFPGPEFLDPDEVSIPSIGASLDPAYPKIVLLHKDVPLQLCCMNLKVYYGVNPKYHDYAGNPKLNIVVDAHPSLCRVFDECQHLAMNLSLESGSRSEWNPLLTMRNGVETIRLHIPIVEDGATATYSTEMFRKEPSGSIERLDFNDIDVAELESLFVPGTPLDAHFSLEVYDYQQRAGIRLVAERLIVHCEED